MKTPRQPLFIALLNRIAILTGVCAIALALPLTSMAGAGGSSGSGGGGSGVACFKNPKSAAQAQDERTHGQPLSRDLISDIATLQITDYWELEGRVEYVQPLPNEEVDHYLQRSLTALSNAAPTFSNHLQSALSRIHLNKSQTVAPIEDLGALQRPIPDATLCSFVQIAARYAVIDAEGRAAQPSVTIDSDLYALLGIKDGVQNVDQKIINQALLKLHEAIYLIGFELGQVTSEKARNLSRFLLNARIWSSLQAQLGLVRARNVNMMFIMETEALGFGDAVALYSKTLPADDILRVRQSGFTQMRKLTWQSMARFRSEHGSPTDEAFAATLKRDPSVLYDFIIDGYEHDVPLMNDAAAFATVAVNAEQNGFVTDSVSIYDRSQQGDAKKKISQICAYAHIMKDKSDYSWVRPEQLPPLLEMMGDLQTKALSHCALEQGP